MVSNRDDMINGCDDKVMDGNRKVSSGGNKAGDSNDDSMRLARATAGWWRGMARSTTAVLPE